MGTDKTHSPNFQSESRGTARGKGGRARPCLTDRKHPQDRYDERPPDHQASRSLVLLFSAHIDYAMLVADARQEQSFMSPRS